MFELFTNKKKKKQLSKESGIERVTIQNINNFAVTEGYKQLRTNLMFLMGANDSNIIEFSSSFAGEGKSVTSANSAIAIAQASQNVLLIDCDLRKPVQHKVFGLKNEMGLSTILGKMSTFENTVNKKAVPNLDVITSGPIPPNPSELFASEKMKKFLETVSQQYDYVVLDTPPINLVTDALELSKYSGGLVLVVRHGVTTYDDIKRSLGAANFVDVNVLGVVLNGVQDAKLAYKKGYKKYGYGKYGYSRYGYGGYDTDNREKKKSKK